jgi:hypothetical protein
LSKGESLGDALKRVISSQSNSQTQIQSPHTLFTSQTSERSQSPSMMFTSQIVEKSQNPNSMFTSRPTFDSQSINFSQREVFAEEEDKSRKLDK